MYPCTVKNWNSPSIHNIWKATKRHQKFFFPDKCLFNFVRKFGRIKLNFFCLSALVLVPQLENPKVCVRSLFSLKGGFGRWKRKSLNSPDAVFNCVWLLLLFIKLEFCPWQIIALPLGDIEIRFFAPAPGRRWVADPEISTKSAMIWKLGNKCLLMSSIRTSSSS